MTTLQSADHLKTVLDCLKYTQGQLDLHTLSFGHGYPDAQAEALSLVSHALGLKSLGLNSLISEQDYATEVSDLQKNVLLNRLSCRCIDKRPLAYIHGEITFHGLRFLCDQRALVPRSLIAELLNDQLTPWVINPDAVEHVLDLCTGGASLAIFAYHAFPNAVIWASDISHEALDLAHENLQLHAIDTNQIKLIKSDLFAAISPQRFDLIISNPPYVNAESMNALPSEFLQEPDGALGAGHDGMDIVKRIIQDAHYYLQNDGLLVIEIGHEADHLLAALPDYEFAFLPVQAGDEMVVAIGHQALIAGHARRAKKANLNKDKREAP